MIYLGAILLAAISCLFFCKATMTARVSLQVTMVDRGRTMIPSTTLLLKLPGCYLNSISMTEWSPALSSSTHTCVNERITDMMSAGPFVEGLKCSGSVFWRFSSFAWQRGTLQFIWSLFITFWSICKLLSYKLSQQTLWKLIFVSFSKLLDTTVYSQRPCYEWGTRWHWDCPGTVKVLQDWGNVAFAVAINSLMNAMNLSYPNELCYTLSISKGFYGTDWETF